MGSILCHLAYHEIRCGPSYLQIGTHLLKCLSQIENFVLQTQAEDLMAMDAMCKKSEVKAR